MNVIHPAGIEDPAQEESLIERLLAGQRRLDTPVARFSEWHARARTDDARRFRDLVPLSGPQHGEQLAFEVNLDQCTACKACVTACHSLNGLDDDESWREVGFLTAEDAPYAQSVTTACHHCLEPACLHGCPVLAYEKDERTGIVRHLDDQCIGCSYCVFKCPYDVPRFNRKRGIVRKCDMCSQRLAVNEPPACVQACPNEAIGIRVINVADVRDNSQRPGARLLPGVVGSAYTVPTTRYVTAKPIPRGARPDDTNAPLPEPAHLPLVVMLLLTQWATGVLFVSRSAIETWFGFCLIIAGLASSVAHLGQPLKAWRAFLGWRTSWLSREIIVFGAWPTVAFAAALDILPPWAAGSVGLLGVFCSIMVYADTRRPFWSLSMTAVRFFGTTAVLGAATAAVVSPAWCVPAAGLAVLKLALECALLNRSGSLMTATQALLEGPVGIEARLRVALVALGAVAALFSPPWSLALLVAAEFVERLVFFRAAAAWRMPGTR